MDSNHDNKKLNHRVVPSLYILLYLYIYKTPDPAAPRPLTKQKPQEHVTTCLECHRYQKNLTRSGYTFENKHCLRCYTVRDQSLGNHRRHILWKTSLHSTGTIDLELLIMMRIQTA